MKNPLLDDGIARYEPWDCGMLQCNCYRKATYAVFAPNHISAEPTDGFLCVACDNCLIDALAYARKEDCQI